MPCGKSLNYSKFFKELQGLFQRLYWEAEQVAVAAVLSRSLISLNTVVSWPLLTYEMMLHQSSQEKPLISLKNDACRAGHLALIINDDGLGAVFLDKVQSLFSTDNERDLGERINQRTPFPYQRHGNDPG